MAAYPEGVRIGLATVDGFETVPVGGWRTNTLEIRPAWILVNAVSDDTATGYAHGVKIRWRWKVLRM